MNLEPIFFNKWYLLLFYFQYVLQMLKILVRFFFSKSFLFSYLSGIIIYGKGFHHRFFHLPYHQHIEFQTLHCPWDQSLLPFLFFKPLINLMSFRCVYLTTLLCFCQYYFDIIFLFSEFSVFFCFCFLLSIHSQEQRFHLIKILLQ